MKRRPAAPLTVFGKKLGDPVYTCAEHGSALSEAGAVLDRLPGGDVQQGKGE
jgi:hypothetical protein